MANPIWKMNINFPFHFQLKKDSVWGDSDTVLKMAAPSSIAGHQVHQSAVASLMSTHHPNSLSYCQEV